MQPMQINTNATSDCTTVKVKSMSVDATQEVQDIEETNQDGIVEQVAKEKKMFHNFKETLPQIDELLKNIAKQSGASRSATVLINVRKKFENL